ncbi:MAG: adenylosuccinate synthetase [Terriglobales bacterium]
MSLWVVVGGQFGGEGKGKISAVITRDEEIDVCVRCGGPNSGHSFVNDAGQVVLLRQLPTGFIRPRTRLLIPAGALVDLEVLKYELDAFGIDPKRVGVDRNAMIIEERDKERELGLQLRERLSSTLCGVGSAVARRALRGTDVRTAQIASKEVPWLEELITNVSEETNSALDQGKSVLVEGTQGFGLSLYHSDSYPKATSRDTTAAGFLSEVGLSPVLVTEIVLVFRTFPIRVAGEQAGPLKDEITWEILQNESGYPHPIQEMTTVSKKLRRVGRFDWDLATRAVQANRPTLLAINGLDYLDFRDYGARYRTDFSSRTSAFLREIESRFHIPVHYQGLGPAINQMLRHVSTDDAEAGFVHS